MIVGILGKRFQRAIAVALLLVVAVASCDSSTDPDSSLPDPSFPEVAGTYTGSVTSVLTAGDAAGTITGTLRVVVAQEEDRVTLSGSVTVNGETEALGGPFPGTIDEAGAWTETGAATAFVPGDDHPCGYTNDQGVRFSRGSLTVAATATVPEPDEDCPNIRISAELTRT